MVKLFKGTLALILTLMVGSFTAAHASDDEAKITAAVMDYFEGQGEASHERLSRAFHPKSRMMGPSKNKEGKIELRLWEMTPTIGRWGNGKPAKGERIGKILNMHIMDNRLASVSFDSNGRFFDLLTLAKLDGEWKIINKAFIRQKKKK